MNEGLAGLLSEDRIFYQHQFCSHCGREMRVRDDDLSLIYVFVECPKRKSFLFGNWRDHDSIITNTRMEKWKKVTAKHDTVTGQRIR